MTAERAIASYAREEPGPSPPGLITTPGYAVTNGEDFTTLLLRAPAAARAGLLRGLSNRTVATLARHVRDTGAGTFVRDDRVPVGGFRIVLTNYDIDGDDLKLEHQTVLDADVIPLLVDRPSHIYLQGGASHSAITTIT